MRTALYGLALVTLCGSCAQTPRAYSGPPPLPLGAAETLEFYRSHQPRSFKMRHQVESKFFGQSQIMSGYLLGLRAAPPDPPRYWIRAASVMGTTLFDVKVFGPGNLEVDLRIPDLDARAAPLFLARDIRRIYFRDCPAQSPMHREGSTWVVQCPLDVDEAPIDTEVGPDHGDDGLTMTLSLGGVVLSKCFHKQARDTACIDYADYRQVETPAGPSWFAHRVELRHQELPYSLTIALLDVDPTFDVERVLPEPASP